MLFDKEIGIIPQFLSEEKSYGKVNRDNALLLQGKLKKKLILSTIGLAGCGKTTVCQKIEQLLWDNRKITPGDEMTEEYYF